MAEQTASANIKQPEENKSGFDLLEAGTTNKSNEEIGKVEGRYFAELDKAIVDEERQKAEEEFEPLPSFLLGEEEKTAVTSRPVFTLFINNLPAGINKNGVANVFIDFELINIKIIRKKMDNRDNTNFAKVSFGTRQEAVSAIQNVDKEPPLYLNVVFERSQEARDFQNKKQEEMVKFGEEWNEKLKEVESKKETIVKKIIAQETVEPSNVVESGSRSIQMDQDNWIAPKNGVEEENKQSCTLKGDSEMTTKDTVEVEASNNFKGKKKSVPSSDEVDSVTERQSSGTNSSADSPAIFGYELFVPYLAPCPCLECRQPGRMLCSRCQAWYCSLSCQVNNWPKHKDLCRPVHKEGGITLLGEGSKSNKRNSSNVSLERKKREKSSVRGKANGSFDSQLVQARSTQNNGEPPNRVAGVSKTASGSSVHGQNTNKFSKSMEELTLAETNIMSQTVSSGVVFAKETNAFETRQSSSTHEIENVGTVRPTNIPEDEVSGIIEPVLAYNSSFKAVESEMQVQATIVPGNQWTEIIQPISAIESPHRFWVQPKFNQELLKKLGKALDQHVATAADIIDANEGVFRLVEVGGCWHRALVIHVDHNSQEALVRLVDLGGDIDVKCSSLLRLPPHLAATPVLAVKVGMAAVKPPHGDHWTKEDGEKFRFFLCANLNETRMWIKPVGVSDGTLLVSMKDHEGNDCAEFYIELGLARKVNQVEVPAIEAIQTENNNVSPSAEVDKATEAIQTEDNNVSPSGEEQNPNLETTGYAVEFPSVEIMPTVNQDIPPCGESGINSNGLISEYLETIPLSGRKEEDLFSTNCNTPKSIIDQLKVGNVYEFGRAEGHPLSEFGAMCHFDSATFAYIYNDMQREYNGSDQHFGPDNPANPGDMVVTYCADKSTFYRAVVLNLPTMDDAEVLLADVGDTEVVQLQHLRVMAGRATNHDEFPFLAVRFFSLDSLSPRAEGTMTTDPGGKIRVRVESVEEEGAVVGVLNKANTVVAKYKVDAWQCLHPRIGHLFPTEINRAFPKTAVSRHRAVFVSQMRPVKITDGDTVILRTIGKFACFGMIQLTETEPTFRALKQALAICETLPRVDFPPEVGQILAVQKSAGRKMMRAEVVKIDESGKKATVRCLDYPDHLVLPWTNMTLIPDTALSIPTQCRQMRLTGVPMIPRKPALSLLQPIAAILERPLRLEYLHEDQSVPSIYLYESSGSRMNELIISTLAQSNTGEVQDSPPNPPISSISAKAKSKKKVSSTNMTLEYDPANCLTLPVGKYKEVSILNVKDKSDLVHVCSVDVLEQLNNLQESLQKIGSSSLMMNSASSVAVNNVYLAQSVDGNWYRAVVLKTRDQKCVAYFPDFGFKEKIAFEKIRDFHGELDRYVKAPPFFASACVINNMTDENGNDRKVLGDIYPNSTHMIRMRSKDAELYSIDVLNLQSD